MTLAERVLAGDPRAMARAISLIEDENPATPALIRAIFRRTGRAYLVGVTGPPGAGKSTLVDRLTSELRRLGQTVGVIAVDPTSPFTGGAVLGDRLRMQTHAEDHAVFIRSMATRGHLGGLARATGDAALVLDAAGKEVILIETVGVGQDEVDIIRTADISIVTLVPGAGDDVQALKAGIMEIADIFVVNKADREGADRVVTEVEANLALRAYGPGEWRPPILKTIATTGAGVAELVAAIWTFREEPGRTSFNAPHALVGDKQFFWHVQAYDTNTNASGPWSDVQVFRTAVPAIIPGPGPGGGAGKPCGPPYPNQPFGIVQCRRSQYGHMSDAEIVSFLRGVAKDLNAAGISGGPFGILTKPSGHNCGGYSCDFICNPRGDGWDVLIDAEGAQTPIWGTPKGYPSDRSCQIQ